VQLDDGAVRALRDGGSLLSVGVVSVAGSFGRGDVVTLKNSSGKPIGRGLAEYSADETMRLLGVRSDKIEAVLGYRGRASMVHRDELVLFDHE
jgi:glutamate 5-kinase